MSRPVCSLCGADVYKLPVCRVAAIVAVVLVIPMMKTRPDP